MRAKTTIKSKIIYYLRNFSILLSKFDSKILRKFLKYYIVFLVEESDIYLNSFLLKCELIKTDLYNKLESQNVSILELTLQTKFEIANKFEISLYEATILSYFTQFHYSNIFTGLVIYYAHSLENYFKSIEEKEIKLIKDNFPFAFVINPSTFEKNWRRKHYSNDQIMQKCLNFVSKSDLVIFSPLNKNSISRGVFEEISEATRLNIRPYLIFNNKLQDYLLHEINEKDWKNYCSYKPVSLIRERMSQNSYSTDINQFLIKNKKLIQENIFSKEKKYLIISNTTKQTETILKNLFDCFDDPRVKILPIIGKKPLCSFEHLDGKCFSGADYEISDDFDYFNTLRKNFLSVNTRNLVQAIKRSTPEGICPYSLLYSLPLEANIIIINKIFFKSTRLRTNLRKKIIFKNPFQFIVIFDGIKDLFEDNLEGRCSVNDLKEGISVLHEKNNQNYVKARVILQNLVTMKEGEKLEVDYFLTKFLEDRYEKRTEDTNILENIYEICKTPFGYWYKKRGEVVQIIESKSLKNFLKFFFKVNYLDASNNKISQGGELAVRI